MHIERDLPFSEKQYFPRVLGSKREARDGSRAQAKTVRAWIARYFQQINITVIMKKNMLRQQKAEDAHKQYTSNFKKEK